MRKIIVVFVAMFTILNACSKGVGNTPSPPAQEPGIAFDLDVTGINIALGSVFDFNVKLTSAIPSAQGIKLKISAVEEGTTILISPQSPDITSIVNTIAARVINLPIQKWVIVTVNVSSVATPSNSLSKTFRVVHK
jgi:hypothetical protein